jgi:hypothetical protein
MIKRQLRTIIICAVAFVVCVVAYFVVVKPLIASISTETDEVPELLDGEVLGTNNRILMMEHLEKADMQSIEIHNSHGSYTMYRGSDEEFYIKGHEGAPYSLEALSSLVVSAGYTLSISRVGYDFTDEEMSAYGLGPNDDYAWYTITKLDGTTHTIHIGDLIPTGGGYYAAYEGRNAVYVLDTTLASTILADVTSIITPILSYPLSTTTYYMIDDFYLYRAGDVVVWIDFLTGDEMDDAASLGSYVMNYPAEYTPNTTNYDTILQKLAAFYGTACVELGPADSAIDPDHLRDAYGIDLSDPAYGILYTYNKVNSAVYFSKPDENGVMYAYSSLFNLVATVNYSDVTFLDWDLIKFVDRPVFYKNINDIASISIEGKDVSETFKLDGESTDIIITPQSTGKAFDADSVQNFRQLYKGLLSINMEDYTEVSDISGLDCMMTLSVTTDKGDTTVYKFYQYATRRCFYTINGVGQFYTLSDQIQKILNDTVRVVNGEPIDADGKS